MVQRSVPSSAYPSSLHGLMHVVMSLRCFCKSDNHQYAYGIPCSHGPCSITVLLLSAPAPLLELARRALVEGGVVVPAIQPSNLKNWDVEISMDWASSFFARVTKSSKKLVHRNFMDTHPSHHKEWATPRKPCTDRLAPKGRAV